MKKKLGFQSEAEIDAEIKKIETIMHTESHTMKNNIEDIKKELIEVREAKKIQSQAYSTLMEARQKVMGDVPKMFEERETINAKIREKIMERNALRDEFNTRQRAFSAYLTEARALRAERGRLERESREKEWDERRKSEMPDG